MPERIAIVHSDASVTELLETILEEEGYEPIPYEQPTAALELMKITPPHLAIVELSLAGSEQSLVDALRANPSTAHIPVLGLTTSGDIEAVRPPSCRENCEILTEPFDIDMVVGLIRSLLRRPESYRCG